MYIYIYLFIFPIWKSVCVWEKKNRARKNEQIIDRYSLFLFFFSKSIYE